jgi:2-polyprenyl-3-methyl-5-hydroxy-6-metoxy-1,4-benzoquinol methylase
MKTNRRTKVDYSLDRIGVRLSGKGLTKHERVLAQDDRVRVRWILDHTTMTDAVVDIGASDGSISERLVKRGQRVFAIERHPAHREALSRLENCWIWRGDAIQALPLLTGGGVALCGEVLEHLTPIEGRALLRAIKLQKLVVTVPNRASRSYDKSKRSRWNWPDHRRNFRLSSLHSCLADSGWIVERVEPIVGTINDSIWLGAVCWRA